MHVCGSFSRRTTSVRLGYLWQLQSGSFPTFTQGATLKTEQKSPSTQNFVKRRFSERPRIPERKNLIFKNTNVDGQIWKITFVSKCNALCLRKCFLKCVNSRVCYRQTSTTMSRAISYPATSGDSRISNVGGKRRPQYFFPSQHFFRIRSSKMNSRPRGGCKCFVPVMGDPPPTRGNLNCYTKSVRQVGEAKRN